MKYFLILLFPLFISCKKNDSFDEKKLSFEIISPMKPHVFLEEDSRQQIKSIKIHNDNEHDIYVFCPDTVTLDMSISCLDKRVPFWSSKPGKFRSLKPYVIKLSKKSKLSFYAFFPKQENLYLCDAFRLLFTYSINDDYKNFINKSYIYQQDSTIRKREVIFSKNMQYKKIRPFTIDVINEEDMNLK